MKPLLPQPGGFEGLGLTRVVANSDDHASLHLGQSGDHESGGSACPLAAGRDLQGNDDLLGGVDEPLRLQPETLPFGVFHFCFRVKAEAVALACRLRTNR